MSADQIVQWTVVALVVTLSAFEVFRRLAPAQLRRLRTAVALYLLQPQRGALARRLGRRIAPAPPKAQVGCGTGSCNTCADARPNSIP